MTVPGFTRDRRDIRPRSANHHSGRSRRPDRRCLSQHTWHPEGAGIFEYGVPLPLCIVHGAVHSAETEPESHALPLTRDKVRKNPNLVALGPLYANFPSRLGQMYIKMSTRFTLLSEVARVLREGHPKIFLGMIGLGYVLGMAMSDLLAHQRHLDTLQDYMIGARHHCP